MRNNYDNPRHQNSLVTRRELVSGIAAAAAISTLAPEFAFAADTQPERDKPMPPRTSSFKLSNGVLIPDVGFGTWQIPDGDKAYDSVAFALANGYRHIDTARAYGNEASVGRAIRDSKLPRDQVFVTSKCPAEIKDAAGAHLRGDARADPRADSVAADHARGSDRPLRPLGDQQLHGNQRHGHRRDLSRSWRHHGDSRRGLQLRVLVEQRQCNGPARAVGWWRDGHGE